MAPAIWTHVRASATTSIRVRTAESTARLARAAAATELARMALACARICGQAQTAGIEHAPTRVQGTVCVMVTRVSAARTSLVTTARRSSAPMGAAVTARAALKALSAHVQKAGSVRGVHTRSALSIAMAMVNASWARSTVRSRLNASVKKNGTELHAPSRCARKIAITMVTAPLTANARATKAFPVRLAIRKRVTTIASAKGPAKAAHASAKRALNHRRASLLRVRQVALVMGSATKEHASVTDHLGVMLVPPATAQ